ncbi:MAG: hypothetical protein U0Z17_05050 [Bacteroidales bacterium]
MKYLVLLLFLPCSFCFSQKVYDSLDYENTFAAYHANTMSTHPFGIFISRISPDFQLKPSKKISVSLTISSGNVWLPYVKAYIPVNEADRDAMSRLIWHEREGNFDLLNTPSRTMDFEADGTIRLCLVKLNIPVSRTSELRISTRMFSLDSGRLPYSSLTSDQFIEWFHSHISGGEDPFARKVYGYNHACIAYTDQDGNVFRMQNHQSLFTGIDLSYYYYPQFTWFENRNFYMSLGFQLGINVNKVNAAADIGINPTLVKRFILTKHSEIHFGAGLGLLKQSVVRFKEGVALSNADFLFSSEFLLKYLIRFRNLNSLSVATNYWIQNAYNKPDEFDYMVLTGERISTHWNYAISHLYRPITANSLIITYTKGDLAFSVYFREDLLVDNAPDLQTGVGVMIKL